MDDFSSGGEALREALRHLRRLNRIFGAAGPTLYGVERLWSAAGQPSRLSVLDVGSGSGDVNRRLLRWAAQRDVRLELTLVDMTEEACGEARALYRHEPRVRVVRGDLRELPRGCADIVTATQLMHHFTEEELPGIVHHLLEASRVGVAINDIHRHWIAWLAVWLVTRLISRNRYICHDGPLSVAKGFRTEEWNRLKETLGSEFSVSWRPMFRYAVIVGRTAAADEAGLPSEAGDREAGGRR